MYILVHTGLREHRKRWRETDYQTKMGSKFFPLLPQSRNILRSGRSLSRWDRVNYASELIYGNLGRRGDHQRGGEENLLSAAQ